MVEVAEVMLKGNMSTCWIRIGAAGVRWPFHLCHLQPVSEVNHSAAFKLGQVNVPLSALCVRVRVCVGYLCLEGVPGVCEPLVTLEAKI